MKVVIYNIWSQIMNWQNLILQISRINCKQDNWIEEEIKDCIIFDNKTRWKQQNNI